jgi:hypothetical protein
MPPASPAKRQAEALQSLGMKVEIFACRGRGFYTYLAAWTRLRPRLHRGRYDVVHAQDIADVLLALPKRVPLVVSVDRLRLGTRLLVRRADAVVVQSEEVGRQFRKQVVHVLSPGLDDATRAARLVEVYRSLTPTPTQAPSRS